MNSPGETLATFSPCSLADRKAPRGPSGRRGCGSLSARRVESSRSRTGAVGSASEIGCTVLLPNVARRGERACLLWLAWRLAGRAVAAPDSRDRPETIVVTGERVKRSLKETSSSVSVFDAARHRGGVGGPGRAHAAAGAERAARQRQRGAGDPRPGHHRRAAGAARVPRRQPAADDGGRRWAADRPINEFVFGTAAAWDLDRIEVFRSPQTTTQGQNSIAGAIFVYYGRPDVRARGPGAADRRQFQTGAAGVGDGVGAGAGDEVAFRVAGDFRYSRTTSRIADRIEGGDPNHDVYGLARAKLLVKPRGAAGYAAAGHLCAQCSRRRRKSRPRRAPFRRGATRAASTGRSGSMSIR